MIVLGVDPGTAIVGYSVIEYVKSKYRILDYGCVYTDKDEDMPVRLEKIYDGLDGIIKIWKPQDMAIEELFFFKNQKTVIKVGQARGVITLCGQKNCLDLYSYTPLQVKMGIAGYGRADKKQIQEMVKVILGMDEIPKPDDAADALAIAITHINSKAGFGSFSRGDNLSKKLGKLEGNKISVSEYKKLMGLKK
ncbi:Crossover junction endodeoxyribonuclease RuvC [Sebaldella termitidis]|jgi:crossover junction endodeoxyribonuclease RuvC|uniref:Crossover junction endodeoxyribonuclease RuvC n=1 Tax=Sebaldella termitidis (strain ATCC 33386 / NCTC 11300) TaxID=526218 RepID=D1AI79_SEBTE|nr:crossover junction endodeoxyribonuclease RuvC [Sebaldella termitidis]ACZ08463.1 crossover junction endodeoxyribonuclease RuvC [Sebaldella termitidis ATCC 33386]SUI23776.1 Crossover junction endodeoxyribonuclease RuvC [Sebaldella termitidis]